MKMKIFSKKIAEQTIVLNAKTRTSIVSIFEIKI